MGVEAAYDAGWLYIQAGCAGGLQAASLQRCVTVCSTVVCNVIVLLRSSG